MCVYKLDSVILQFWGVVVFAPHGSWDLSSVIRDGTRALCSVGSLSHWTTREVPVLQILKISTLPSREIMHLYLLFFQILVMFTFFPQLL